jgi:ABC-type oligopeptide transport system ATPase subunit
MTEPGAAASPLLEVRGLRKYFRARGRGVEERLIKAVDDVSLSVSAGETVALVGESGSGKSTTAYCILRLENVTGGSVFFQGQDITHLSARSLRPVRRDMNVIFQDPLASLNPRMTIGDIITEPLAVHGIGDPASRRARMRELLDRVGLSPGTAARKAHELSGGQGQRVGIARALALEPKLIVCDEPVSSLDVSIQAQILNLLKDIQQESDVAYLFITHDLAVVRWFSHRIEVMRSGRIVESGPTARICAEPREEYTKALLAAAPVPDPRAMRQRRADREDLLAAHEPTG